MANTNENVNVNTEAVEDDEPIRVVVDQKEGFGTKAKDFFGKVVHSTPGKIIGGLGLVALGAVGAVLAVALKSDDDEDKDEEETNDYEQYIVDEDESNDEVTEE